MAREGTYDGSTKVALPRFTTHLQRNPVRLFAYGEMWVNLFLFMAVTRPDGKSYGSLLVHLLFADESPFLSGGSMYASLQKRQMRAVGVIWMDATMRVLASLMSLRCRRTVMDKDEEDHYRQGRWPEPNQMTWVQKSRDKYI